MRFIAILLAVFTSSLGYSQGKLDSLFGKIDPQHWAQKVGEKSSHLEDKLIRKSQQTLSKLQKQETRIYKKMLHTKDSLLAKEALGNIEKQYKALGDQLKDSTTLGNAAITKEYIPYVDTLQSALGYLDHSGVKGVIPTSLSQIQSLNSRFQQTADIKAFIQQRKQLLQHQLESIGMLSDLKRFNKEAYYYAARIKEWKAIISDPKKIEKKAIQVLAKTRVFQDFMKRNSILASLFPVREDINGVIQANSAGLQSRSIINNLIQQQISSGGPNAMQQFQQNIQSAQSQISQLKDKVLKYGGSNSDDILPEGFNKNEQKTKTFSQRLEYGINVQSQKATNYFPVTSAIGLSLGYKLNDRSVIGVGFNYKIGWGTDWKNINISGQGIGLRSFADVKLKGSIWVTCGYERDYKAAVRNISLLQSGSEWQERGLAGISKIISMKTKLFKKTRIQFLWDFLSYQQIPKAQPIVFRIGYNF